MLRGAQVQVSSGSDCSGSFRTSELSKYTATTSPTSEISGETKRANLLERPKKIGQA